MGSQKWKLQKIDQAMIWVPLLENLKHSNPEESTMYVRVIKLNWQELICGILALASFIHMVIHRYTEMSKVWRATSSQSFPNCRCHICFYCFLSFLLLVFLFYCWQGAQSNLILKYTFPAKLYGLSWVFLMSILLSFYQTTIPCVAQIPSENFIPKSIFSSCVVQ